MYRLAEENGPMKLISREHEAMSDTGMEGACHV